ncbi:nicolin-1 isoform X3 [Gymnodraco acuticeps]|uniref:Nicolin-1 isoform X3 n=1 Tax=Gymnodraco acuticeps TaxID=8218 RepID=A0A6P8SLP1_GYMAC|nr:nicolin-1 isoform X3 [Gymnodraco acuticeps]
MSSSSSDVLLPVDSSIKPPVFLHLGDTEPLSGVCVLDVTLPFGKTVNVEEISFKNHYTASVSMRLLRTGPPSQWVTAVRDLPLMENPHTEGGSQDYCCIHRTQDPEKEVSDWLSDLTLADQHTDLEGLPPPQSVSSSLQQMFALTEVMMQSNETTASIGRFHVDGCYDINLLSLL